MSATDAAPTPTAIARRRMTGASRSRWSARHRLRVPDAVDPVAVGRHDHGRGDDRAGRGGDADLVHAHDAARAIPPQGAFPAERGDDDGHRSTAYRARPRTGTPLATPAGRMPDSGPCSARSARSTCSRPSPGSATRSRSCSTATGSRPRRCSGSRPGRTCPRRRSSWRRPIRPPTTRVRIFTPTAEIPFAGHPTLGTCHAWLEAGGVPRDPATIVQHCGSGLVDGAADRGRPRLPRAADAPLGPGGRRRSRPRRRRPGHRARRDPRLDLVRQRARLDGGPARERGARPRACGSARRCHLDLGIVGLYPPGAPAALEVRAAWPEHGSIVEDPATGSLNASVARWLIDAGRIRAPYVATQGGAIGRAARILDHPGPRRDDPRRRAERHAGRGIGRPLARLAGPDMTRPRTGRGRRGARGRRCRPEASGARGASWRPCPRGCAGSTASRGGPGRGGRPRSSRSAGCGS